MTLLYYGASRNEMSSQDKTKLIGNIGINATITECVSLHFHSVNMASISCVIDNRCATEKRQKSKKGVKKKKKTVEQMRVKHAPKRLESKQRPNQRHHAVTQRWSWSVFPLCTFPLGNEHFNQKTTPPSLLSLSLVSDSCEKWRASTRTRERSRDILDDAECHPFHSPLLAAINVSECFTLAFLQQFSPYLWLSRV